MLLKELLSRAPRSKSNQVIPKVCYQKGIEPIFQVAVDAVKCGELLRLQGVPNKHIQSLKIEICQTYPPDPEYTRGHYFPAENLIRLYAHTIWQLEKRKVKEDAAKAFQERFNRVTGHELQHAADFGKDESIMRQYRTWKLLEDGCIFGINFLTKLLLDHGRGALGNKDVIWWQTLAQDILYAINPIERWSRQTETECLPGGKWDSLVTVSPIRKRRFGLF